MENGKSKNEMEAVDIRMFRVWSLGTRPTVTVLVIT